MARSKQPLELLPPSSLEGGNLIISPRILMTQSKKEASDIFATLATRLGWTEIKSCGKHSAYVEVICPIGHKTRKDPKKSIYQNKIECRECQRAAIKTRDSTRFIERLEAVGWEALEPYTASLTKTRVACPNGHEQLKTPSQLKVFQACKSCPKKERSVNF